MAANSPVACPRCNQQRPANEAFCGNCGMRLRGAAMPAAQPQSYARLAAQPAAPQRPVSPQPTPLGARPKLFGLWTQPATSRDWLIFATQWLVPLGFLLVIVAAMLGWGQNSLYSILSVAFSLAMALVWVAVLALPRARLPKNWQWGAAGCLAVPGLIIAAIAALSVIQPILALLSNAGVPLLACIGGVLPLGALVFLLNRK